MTEPPSYLTPEQIAIWKQEINRINSYNIFCHCRKCDYEWIASTQGVCCISCGSHQVAAIACWQFPDD